MSKDAFICTKNVLGMDNICFGSDYPYETIDEMIDFLDDVPISHKERGMLFYKNAIEKLGIPAD
jgi:predicted TIM-barrel fold metal-dependent hydrolase